MQSKMLSKGPKHKIVVTIIFNLLTCLFTVNLP